MILGSRLHCSRVHWIVFGLAVGALWGASSKGVTALSCALFSPAIAISTAHVNGAEVRLVEGQLRFKTVFGAMRSHEAAKLNPDQVWIGQATFIGTDFETGRPLEMELDVERSCIAVWCGATFDLPQSLIVLHKENENYKIILKPCGEHFFPLPTRRERTEIEACLRGEICR